MTPDVVVKLVSSALNKHADPRLGTQLLILIEGIQQRDGWWIVPVYPAQDVPRMYDMYNSLAMAEEELETSGLKIQLIPAHAPESVQ
ncbi:MAG TPA: hypothetical protein VKX17_01505 [Planctomycetota bacterium]|nr:hypothetical protein [Planctomycetota bacterium]